MTRTQRAEIASLAKELASAESRAPDVKDPEWLIVPKPDAWHAFCERYPNPRPQEQEELFELAYAAEAARLWVCELDKLVREALK